MFFLVLGVAVCGLFYIYKTYFYPNRTPIDKKTIESSSDYLVVINAEGGLCPDGPCFSQSFIRKNGDSLNGQGSSVKLGKNELSILTSEIQSTDFEKIKSKPFTEMCPSAYDGPEVTYYIFTQSGVESIGSCQYDIEDVELIKTIHELLNQN